MTFYYLATPYSKYHKGTEAAFQDACRLAAELIRRGVHFFAPIAHTHPIAKYGYLEERDLNIWLKFDEHMMARCDALLVAHMEGWAESRGIAYETDYFIKADKPIWDLYPETMEMSERV